MLGLSMYRTGRLSSSLHTCQHHPSKAGNLDRPRRNKSLRESRDLPGTAQPPSISVRYARVATPLRYPQLQDINSPGQRGKIQGPGSAPHLPLSNNSLTRERRHRNFIKSQKTTPYKAHPPTHWDRPPRHFDDGLSSKIPAGSSAH